MHYAVMAVCGAAVHYAVMAVQWCGGALRSNGGAVVSLLKCFLCRKKFAKRPPRLQFASTFFLYIKKIFITHLVKLFTLCTLPRQLKLEMYFE